jgi:hypothetical protein
MRTLDKAEMAVVAGGGNNTISGGNGVGNHAQNGVQNHAHYEAFPNQLFNQVNVAAAPAILDASGSSSVSISI